MSAYIFLYYPSQLKNYQTLIHVACVKGVYWWYSLLHVSDHRAIIRQYTLIIISETILSLSLSYITTDGQSTSLSWYQAPI
jgi:hypothetical protein